jgi:lysyl-tRNA synthetase class 2
MASIDDIRENRIKKLSDLRGKGLDPYPSKSNADFSLVEVGEKFTKLSESKKTVTLVGRVLSLRPQGAIIFFTFDDGTGKFQGFIKKGEIISDEDFDSFQSLVDIGDFVEVSGKLFTTSRGEKTIQVEKWRMLTKSLRPLPEKWHGLQDVEERFRKRYLDLIASPEVKGRFIVRSTIISEIRRNLDKAGFLEVETPMLQELAGGASAEPFKTHHNALGTDFYLRIAPELYLKKLLIGGLPKVYEIGRNFRNEGIDVTHNPEFTSLEYYESFSDSVKQRAFTEKLLKAVVKKVTGGNTVTFDEQVIDFSKKFAVISYLELLERYALINNPGSASLEEIKLKANQLGVKFAPNNPIEKIMDNIYKKTCRPKLIQPTFIIDYPVNYLPLAKKNPKNPKLVDAFQLIVGGLETVKAFTELNDPIDQNERFMNQEKNKAAGDKEAQPNDKDFVEALEYGMPPAGGVGIGIDRLVMLLTNTKNIREVILFPTLRPKQ